MMNALRSQQQALSQQQANIRHDVGSLSGPGENAAPKSDRIGELTSEVARLKKDNAKLQSLLASRCKDVSALKRAILMLTREKINAPE